MNVLLSDEEMEKLKTEFPTDYRDRIERVSEYCASTGKSYKNYLATIRNWAKKDRTTRKDIVPEYNEDTNPQFDEERFNEIMKGRNSE
jgi:phosphopantetheine adenylyltransferase